MESQLTFNFPFLSFWESQKTFFFAFHVVEDRARFSMFFYQEKNEKSSKESERKQKESERQKKKVIES